MKALKNANQRNVLSYFVGTAVLISIVTMVVTATQDIAHKVLPHTYWYEYKETRTLESIVPTGAPFITMQSFAIWKADDMAIEWNDTLTCDFGNGVWVFIGSQVTNGFVSVKDNTDTPGLWKLRIPMPSLESECRVRSGITYEVGGHDKIQIIYSNRFQVIDLQQANEDNE